MRPFEIDDVLAQRIRRVARAILDGHAGAGEADELELLAVIIEPDEGRPAPVEPEQLRLNTWGGS